MAEISGEFGFSQEIFRGPKEHTRDINEVHKARTAIVIMLFKIADELSSPDAQKKIKLITGDASKELRKLNLDDVKDGVIQLSKNILDTVETNSQEKIAAAMTVYFVDMAIDPIDGVPNASDYIIKRIPDMTAYLKIVEYAMQSKNAPMGALNKLLNELSDMLLSGLLHGEKIEIPKDTLRIPITDIIADLVASVTAETLVMIGIVGLKKEDYPKPIENAINGIQDIIDRANEDNETYEDGKKLPSAQERIERIMKIIKKN